MKYLLFIIFVLIMTRFIFALFNENRELTEDKTTKEEHIEEHSPQKEIQPKEIQQIEIQPIEDYSKKYQKKWMFTYNEKNIYREIKKITSSAGYEVFAKVRLLDIIEPIKNDPKYKTHFWKIQAKHVDFVICDQKLVAKYIIELDDSSHNTTERKERDFFVDSILRGAGYKVLRIKGINKQEILSFLDIKKIYTPEEDNYQLSICDLPRTFDGTRPISVSVRESQEPAGKCQH